MMQEGHHCNLNKGNVNLKPIFFYFYFFIQNLLRNTALTIFKLVVDNIHVEGTVSQFFYIDSSFISMSKKGKIFIIFFVIIFLDFI